MTPRFRAVAKKSSSLCSELMELHNECDVSIVLPTVTSDADGQTEVGSGGMIEVDVEERKSRGWQEHKVEKVKAVMRDIFFVPSPA